MLAFCLYALPGSRILAIPPVGEIFCEAAKISLPGKPKSLLLEEVTETCDAIDKGDLVEAVDGLVDVIVVGDEAGEDWAVGCVQVLRFEHDAPRLPPVAEGLIAFLDAHPGPE